MEKISLIFRYLNNISPKDHDPDPTVEDSYSVIIQTSKGVKRSFKILDTAQEEDYQTMIDEWIKIADGFLLVFAINDKESFESLKQIILRIRKNNKKEYPIILVGNKCELEDKREINKQHAMEFAKTIGAKYYETSPLTDENGNCKVVFQQCANMIINFKESKEKSGHSCYII